MQQDVVELLPRFRKMASQELWARTSVPRSVTEDDLVQEAALVALERQGKYVNDGRASFASYLDKVVRGRWADYCAKMRYGPSAQTAWHKAKRGESCDYGEISIECLVSGEGGNWEDWLSAQPYGSDPEVVFYTININDCAGVLREIREQLKAGNMAGIYWAKTRNKWHVEVNVSGKKQFIGQFKELQKAIAAKADFLDSFMDVVLRACDEG